MSEIETIPIVLIGGGSVGKSCLALMYVQESFVEDYDPTIAETYEKDIVLDNKKCHLQIIDTAGQEEYRSARDKYIKLGEGFMIVFSVISRSSFIEAKNLHESIKRAQKINSTQVPAVTVANKLDLQESRIITKEEGLDLAKKYNSPYFETSAKNNVSVCEAFEQIVRNVRAARIKNQQTNANKSVKKKKKRCIIF
ncbi:ras-like protein [Anaeramoeba ignava]|uniref:Ras-like protein n=1 Tax=Anaeramoeba ignava TaxID=1746090 RepID=A0A9Q0L9R9_ANAIG|nr:ras-like protein [Anaeramoeba ignava]